MSSRVERIRSRLERALSPTHLELTDESAAHAGHAGALESGGGHYSALIVAAAFTGESLVSRHKMVYAALGELMHTDIHAFSMKVYSPGEFVSFVSR